MTRVEIRRNQKVRALRDVSPQLTCGYAGGMYIGLGALLLIIILVLLLT